MFELSGYQLSDFLLFSPRVYFRLFALHNEAVWPLHILMIVLGLGLCFVLLSRNMQVGRFVPGTLGIIWIWVGWSFFTLRYATINPFAIYVAPFFALEGALLIWIAMRGNGPEFQSVRNMTGIGAMGVLVFSIAGYPFIAPAMMRSLHTAEVFGIAPDPTAIATLAVLALSRGSLRIMAMLIPAAWCGITALTLWAMHAAS
ncbi:MAG: DUF6064 family protein [Hyphomicrobiaceae bacterium]